MGLAILIPKQISEQRLLLGINSSGGQYAPNRVSKCIQQEQDCKEQYTHLNYSKKISTPLSQSLIKQAGRKPTRISYTWTTLPINLPQLTFIGHSTKNSRIPILFMCTLTRIDRIWGHNLRLNKFKRIHVIQNLCPLWFLPTRELN